MQRLTAVLVCGLAILAGTSANAALISFDPDGSTGANLGQQISRIDLLPGISTGQNLLSGGTVPVAGRQFTQYFKASVGSLLDADDNVININGLASNFELTVTVGFSAIVNFSMPNMYTYTVDGGGPVNFFEIWYDDTPDASDLTGNGFNDGTRILWGAIDGSNTDGYFITNSATSGLIRGFGGMSFGTQIQGYESGFFSSSALDLVLNMSNVPLSGLANPNFRTQSDAYADVSFVPEPASLLLLGPAAALVLGGRRRRHHA